METTGILTKTKWNIDPVNSQMGFRVKHLVFTNVRGSFKEFDAIIYTKKEDFMTAEINLWLNPASIDTGNQRRDTRLKSADLFDVERFKEISFKGGTFVNGDKENSYILYGNLNMKGFKEQIRLDIECSGIIKDPQGNLRVVFSVNGKIDRKDWGLNWNADLETGGILISESVWICCELQLVKEL